MLWILQPGEHSFQTVTFFREVRPTRRSNGSQKPSFILHVDMALVVEQKIRVGRFYEDLGLNLGSSVKELHSKRGEQTTGLCFHG